MKKNIVFTAAIIILVLALWGFRQSKPASPPPTSQPDTPRLVSTKPDPLEDTIIPADQIIEITFSHSLENVPELKTKIEPKTDYKVELSGDRKTAKIIPVVPFELGTTYTLFIMTDSKFEKGARLAKELNFHFRTVKYRGF